MPLPPVLNRDHFLSLLETKNCWDTIVIGGGATGLGIAVDSATRGYRTLLLEGSDFAKGTSSRSTKLVHGGVRYLAQGDIALVKEALLERKRLLQNAPHLVRQQAFIIPCYRYFEKFKYLVGLKIYDWLAGEASLGKTQWLSKDDVLQALPGLNTSRLFGGVQYFDGQFDDARLAINLAQTAAENGAVLLNYCRVTALQKKDGRLSGVIATDTETKKEYAISGKVVINATGVFVDQILCLDTPGKRPLIRPSQGVHLVFDRADLPLTKALMIPKTPDDRVLFALPWHQQVVVGTTDTPLHKNELEPIAQKKEVAFILSTLQQYLQQPVSVRQIRSVFAGLRPLAAAGSGKEKTKEISRHHKLLVSESGLVTITGGKWTTYRKMAEDTVDRAIQVGKLPPASCPTKHLPIHGSGNRDSLLPGTTYGTDQQAIDQLIQDQPNLVKPILPGYPYTEAEIRWFVRAEMARTVEDVLARRLRLLFLDAKAAIAAAPTVAAILRQERNLPVEWEQEQVPTFSILAQNYLPPTAL